MAERKPKPAAKAASKRKPAAKKVAAAKGAAKKPPPDLPGRIDGLRGWLDQIERRQSRMTYIMVAGVLIALATAGVALYLAVTTNQDAVTKGDFDDLSEEVSQVRTQAQSDTQAQVKALSDQITALQRRVAAAEVTAQQAKTAAQQPANTLPSLTPTTPAPTTPDDTGGSGNKNP